MRTARLIAAAVVFLLISATGNASVAKSGEDYVFRVDGYEAGLGTDSLMGNPELADGDIISFGDLNITLAKAGTYNFEDKLHDNACVYRVNRDGSKTVIAVKIGTLLHEEELTPEEARVKLQEYKNSGSRGLPPLRMKSDFRFTNPLDKMTKEEIRQLRGIWIGEWNDTLADKLPFNSPQACVQIGCGEEDAAKVLAALPKDIEYMIVYYNEGILKKLPMFKNLKFLAVGCEECQMDASILADNANLVNLDIGGYDITIAKSQSLSKLKNLRSLNLSGMKNLKDIKFTSSMKGLRCLNIDRTGVTDLRPLDGLQELRQVNALRAPVGMLPQGKFQKLETVNVMGSRVSLKNVEDFEARNPNCVVMFKWNRTIQRMLAEATRVEIRQPAPTWIIAGEMIAADSNVASVLKLVENIKVDPCEIDSGVNCGEDFNLVFYSGSRKLTSIAMVCSDILRWGEAWPSEVRLTKPSGDYIAEWMAEHGHDWMQAERKQVASSEEKNTENLLKSLDGFLATLPDDVSKAIVAKYNSGEEARNKRRQESTQVSVLEYEQMSNAIKSTLKAKYPDDVDRAKVCLRALALYTTKRELPMDALRQLLKDTSSKNKCIAAQELMADAEGRQGTGVYILQMAGYEDFDIQTLNRLLPQIAPDVLQNSNRFQRMSIITCIGKIKTDASHEVLRKILKGEIFIEDKFDPNETTGMPHTCAAHAATYLAHFGDANDLALIEEKAKDAQGIDKRAFEKAQFDLQKSSTPPEYWWAK